jgi:putative transposase
MWTYPYHTGRPPLNAEIIALIERPRDRKPRLGIPADPGRATVRAHRRTEVTDRMLIFSERHLRLVLAEYARRYDGRRPHRALQLQPPGPTSPSPTSPRERTKRQPVLGGLISEYG